MQWPLNYIPQLHDSIMHRQEIIQRVSRKIMREKSIDN